MFIGAENIISPLGMDAVQTFDRMKMGESSIEKHNNILMSSFSPRKKELLSLMYQSISKSLSLLDDSVLTDSKVLLIISTTKGEINSINSDIDRARLGYISDKLRSSFDCIEKSIIVSTACVSGLQSLIIAKDMISQNYYDIVIICGGDLASDFVLQGFMSFYALSDQPCRPFDRDRRGLNIGEAVSTIIMGKQESLFRDSPFKFLAGCSVNDANHISAPHREARGLIKSINHTLKTANISRDEIDFINAHGTATIYNDAMEAYAFSNLDLDHIPVNSFKGYFGHTLGCAGVIETAVCMQSMRNNFLLQCKGFESQDFNPALNILQENREIKVNTILKTSSGFGGVNASAIIQKI